MTDTKNWINHERLEFKNQNLGSIDLTSVKALPNPNKYDFNTELIFDNCTIESFNATVQLIGKPIIFRDCKIGGIWCHATYFFAGLEITNCTIKEASTFDCGVHNQQPNKFIIDNCIFDEHLDFFDVYFEGPVEITNNEFKNGTSIELYLAVPYGIKEGIPFKIENNKGQLDKYAENDPFNPENEKRKTAPNRVGG